MYQKDLYFQNLTPAMRNSKDLRRQKLVALGNHDLEKVEFLLSISYDLTPLGFECFIAYFLEQHYDYKMIVQGGYFDEGIDIKGKRINEHGESEFAIVQCKQWNIKDIWVKDIAEFYGRVADIRYAYPNTNLYYATTGLFTSNARQFLDEKLITYIDFTILLEGNDYINREDFLKYLHRHATEVVLSKKDAHQTQIFIQTNRDVFELLRTIRLELARECKVPAYAIARDQQLCEIIKLRPRSLNEFIGIAGLSQKQVELYGERFIRAFV